MMKTTLRNLFLFVLGLSLTVTAQESRRGTFQVEREVTGGAQNARALNEFRMHVTDLQGTSLYTITKPLPYDVGPPAVGVFESGAAVLLDSFHGILEFYAPDGSLRRSVRLFKEAIPELERQMPFALHDHAVALAVGEPAQSVVRLFWFTEEGEPVFERSLPGQFATGIVMSNAGGVCAVGTAQWDDEKYQERTLLVSGGGTLEHSVDCGLLLGAFNEEDHVLFTTNRHDQVLVSVDDGAVIDRRLADKGTMVLDVRAGGHAFYVLSAHAPSFDGGTWVYGNPVIFAIAPGELRQVVLTEPGREFRTARLENTRGELRLEIDGESRQLR